MSTVYLDMKPYPTTDRKIKDTTSNAERGHPISTENANSLQSTIKPEPTTGNSGKALALKIFQDHFYLLHWHESSPCRAASLLITYARNIVRDDQSYPS